MRRVLIASCLSIIFGFAASHSLASDGRIEINQVRALAGGITPADGPGFPVQLSEPGSYLLTSDLVVPTGNVGIELHADEIHLDLGGFAIRNEPNGLGVSGVASFNDAGANSVIRNGAVIGFSGVGIDLPETAGVRVDEMLIRENAGGGLHLGGRGLVTHARVFDNGGNGMSLARTSAYAYCTVDGPGGGFDVSSGRQLSPSLCGDGSCRAYPPKRRYYLTIGETNGGGPKFMCASGYHFASVFELMEVSQLEYNGSEGRNLDDAGEGPPSGNLLSGPLRSSGWVRTGSAAAVAISTDAAPNCNDWVSVAKAEIGAVAYLPRPGPATLSSAYVAEAPFIVSGLNCANLRPVWCIED